MHPNVLVKKQEQVSTYLLVTQTVTRHELYEHRFKKAEHR